MYMCGSLCVVGGQRRELSAASLAGVSVSRETPLSILARRPHKDLYLYSQFIN